MTIEEYKRLLGKGSLQRQYFEILQDGAPIVGNAHNRKLVLNSWLAEVVFKALSEGRKIGQELLSKLRGDIVMSVENKQSGISGPESFKSQIQRLVYPSHYRRES